MADYLAVVLWFVFRTRHERGQRSFLHHSALVIALPTARGLNLPKAFTSNGISKSGFYLDPGTPLCEKLF